MLFFRDTFSYSRQLWTCKIVTMSVNLIPTHKKKGTCQYIIRILHRKLQRTESIYFTVIRVVLFSIPTYYKAVISLYNHISCKAHTYCMNYKITVYSYNIST